TNSTGCSSTYSDSVNVGPSGIYNPDGSQSAINIQIFPNPFKSKTSISYSLIDHSIVNISVYDMNGKLVTELKKGEFDAGQYTDEFDAGKYHAADGMYLLKMSVNDALYTAKIVNMK